MLVSTYRGRDKNAVPTVEYIASLKAKLLFQEIFIVNNVEST